MSDERLNAAIQKGRRWLQAATVEMRGERTAREQLRHRERVAIRLKPFETKFSSTAPEGSFSGYGAIFGESHPTSAWWLDSDYTDTIAHGAFTRTLAEHKALRTLPAMVWSHDIDCPIGVWTSMTEDRTGLLVEGRLSLSTPQGLNAYTMLQMAAEAGLSGLGLSIGFVVAKSEINDQQMSRRITDIDLAEVSPCVVPAIAGARVEDVKGRR